MLLRSYRYAFIAATALLLPLVAHGQTSALLDACNSIEDKDKRLACFKELTSLQGPGTPANSSSKRVRDSFAALAGVLDSGISLSSYSAMLLEPAKELGILKQDASSANPNALDLFDQALKSYRDAETVWRASIFSSRDAGIFGKVLSPSSTGLSDIVRKYRLPTTTVFLNEHLPLYPALSMIWKSAGDQAKSAAAILDGRSAPPTVSNPVTPTQFQWPVPGEVLAGFDGVKNQGVHLSGKLGDPVSAAASGVVVFASSKLNGYGNLIIIKHDNTFLTAYAHNETLLVKEADAVMQGQTIARMGSSESDRVKLLFEIRQNGVAIDPTTLLPPVAPILVPK